MTSLSSDTLEAFFDSLQNIDDQLKKLDSTEVTNAELIRSISESAKGWFRLSEMLRGSEFIDGNEIDGVDARMQEILRSTTKRTRANTYRKKLGPIIQIFIDQFVVPLIKFEGSPNQVAGRQLWSTFEGQVTSEESQYIDEAVRCVTSQCYRAAIILLWASGIARLHSAIEVVGFKAYNLALDACLSKKGNPFNRVSKSGQITSLPELQRSREFDLIVVGMEMWGYDLQTFEELERLLGIRNSAAHPGMSNPSTLDVQHFAAKLAACIFATIKVAP